MKHVFMLICMAIAISQSTVPCISQTQSADQDINKLVAQLHVVSADERMRAAMQLGDMGPRASAAVPSLIKLLGDVTLVCTNDNPALSGNFSEPLSQVASRALIQIGPAAIEPLIEAFHSTSPIIRKNAAIALTGTDDPRGAAELKRGLQDKDPSVRSLAARMIGRLPDPRIKPLVAALHDPDAKVRLAAAESIEECRSEVPDGLSVGLSDTNPSIRAATVRAIGSLSGTGSAGQAEADLLEMLHDKSPNVRREAVDALPGLTMGFNPVAPLIRRLSDEDKRVRESAVYALTRITGRDFGTNRQAWQRWWNNWYR